MMASMVSIPSNITMLMRPRRIRSKLAALSILAVCSLYVAFSIIDLTQGSRGDIQERRFLRSDDAGVNERIASTTKKLQRLLAKLRKGSVKQDNAKLLVMLEQLNAVVAASKKTALDKPMMVSQGAGPEFTGLAGQKFRFNGAAHPTGVTWYNVLSSPRFEWNMSPIRWKNCPEDGNTFLGDSGFTFHVPHPKDPAKMIAKQLRFRVERRDARDCVWNYSESCLAGGNFVMNFGKSAKDMFRPGDYSLMTSDGVIRIVAYNTNRDCSREITRRPQDVTRAMDVGEKVPMDYVRQGIESTMDPQGCNAWIQKRDMKDDLFSYNSDLATVHIDTPWMQIIIQTRSNKVATKDTCIYANMNVWVANVAPGILGDDVSGLLGGDHDPLSTMAEGPLSSSLRHRTLSYMDAEKHIVDGPFGME
mmetsp:Transcript_2444/g.3734  ORF Transcript_2444/g.3734 Transcript_2444/m.3734 type:complete len:418 (+) Transcript_2444:65-1318(+)|eukprot:CAMPEP_0196150846 /NCGR_PEP_ID=MMETSP0910-20130528/32519_1 /TAXON_ID=49265 /ORGANISM="Thalassiosira rotula, Strain GSO102" /LENGTH=417 /DNA_ID=CAMNT_0041414069 /DNA_START=52 /DNA_END=1305 /DNA_ORIENTATION=+